MSELYLMAKINNIIRAYEFRLIDISNAMALLKKAMMGL